MCITIQLSPSSKDVHSHLYNIARMKLTEGLGCTMSSEKLATTCLQRLVTKVEYAVYSHWLILGYCMCGEPCTDNGVYE